MTRTPAALIAGAALAAANDKYPEDAFKAKNEAEAIKAAAAVRSKMLL